MLGLRSLFKELLMSWTDKQTTARKTEVRGSSSEGRGGGDFTAGLLPGSLMPRPGGKDGKRRQEVRPSMLFFDVNVTSPGEKALHLEIC